MCQPGTGPAPDPPDPVEMQREAQRRTAVNEKILARIEEQTASLKKVSDIHTKAILKILDRI